MAIIIDNDTTYDEDLKRYYLTKDYVLNNLDTNFQSYLIDEFSSNTGKLAEIAIAEACDMVYDYVENNAYDKTTAIFRICTEQATYNVFKKALGYQLLFYMVQGDVSLDLDKKIKDSISRKVVQLLRTINLLNTEYYDIPEDEADW